MTSPPDAGAAPQWRKDCAAAILRFITGVRRLPPELLPARRPVVFFANHGSHLDAPLIWACLPPAWRDRTRPVAGRDYWERNALRRHLAAHVMHAVLIDRRAVSVRHNPLDALRAALNRGDSLLIFPEGTRSLDGTLQPFKSGLYHLARDHPTLPLVPIYLENLSRILPKHELLPVPFVASVFVGPPLQCAPGEDKTAFLERARAALLALQRP
jgi:1-acyl-sn-glycerol-3-phosphate acyltransferase